ncbi:hypothetical protein MMC26_000435 [Xylographa opegraphella]|nr:hypothetical protein [Xylographa opegraphella]
MLLKLKVAVTVGLAIVPMTVAQESTNTAISASQPSNPQATGSDSCGSFAAAQSNYMQNNPGLLPGKFLGSARDAHDCLASISLVSADALQLLGIAEQYTQFHTTLEYLKDPPPSYQREAVDIMGKFETLRTKVSNGTITGQYEFDLELQLLLRSAHDEHFRIAAGVYGLFSFQLSQHVVSVSPDGIQLPKPYALPDIMAKESQGWTASAIQSIEGQSAIDYLNTWSNATGQSATIEPHAGWNELMFNSAKYFGTQPNAGPPTSFANSPVYTKDTLNITFENGTSSEWHYFAWTAYNLATSKFDSAQNIYNNFVLKSTTTSGTSLTRRQSTPASLSSIPYPGYPPNPVTLQESFGNGGFVSGYILNSSLAVLSLPTFESSNSVSDCSASLAVQSFLQNCTRNNIKKILIDLQGNGGGTVLLGYDFFKQFFPNIEPFGGHQLRSFPQVNTIGQALTAITVNDHGNFPPDVEQVIVQNQVTPYDAAFFTQANGTTIGSWGDISANNQIMLNGDNFTQTYRFDLSRSDAFAQSLGCPVFGYGNRSNTGPPPFQAEDITILTDGYCGSTCAVFSEMMKTDGGVKFVVVGGEPSYGPMQAVSGTRGSSVLAYGLIGSYQDEIRKYSSEASSIGLEPSDIAALFDSPTTLNYNLRDSGVNARNQVRRDSEVPLQFIYEAADCRLFYTPAMLQDYTILWQMAVNAASNSSLCVQGSTGNPTAGNLTSTDAPGNSTVSATSSVVGITATLPPSAVPTATGARSMADHTRFAGQLTLVALGLLASLMA